jgi:hypothetical protein
MRCVACAALLSAAVFAEDPPNNGLMVPDVRAMDPNIHEEDIRLHVSYLAGEALEGRLTGTQGEQLATEYAAYVFRALGLRPAGDDGTYFQPFEFLAGVSLGPNNRLALVRNGSTEETFVVDTQWRPLAFSRTGEVAAPIVFAGYGIVAPAYESLPEYDSYVHLDVKDKWVLVFRYIPENVSTERRLHLTQYGGLRQKTSVARDRGAVGLMVVSGPNALAAQRLVALSFDASFAGTSIAAISVDDAVAESILATSGRTLRELQDQLDTGEPMMGFDIPEVSLTAQIDIRHEKRTGRNVLARLDASDRADGSVVVVGAHIDHLGRNAATGSLARDDAERGRIHYGADDNASGVAGLFEIAQWFTSGGGATAPRKRAIVFGAWSGEELGLLGSGHFARTFAPNRDALYPEVAAYVNMDMIGRMNENVIIGGVGSSSIWRDEIRIQNTELGLPIVTQDDSYLPTDATSFFAKGVPFINAFTGAHEDYHTPRDTPDKLNYLGAAQITQFMANVTRSLAGRERAPDFIGQAKPARAESSTGLRAYLGTIPDYGLTSEPGLVIAGTAKGGPADHAGLKSGDRIVELAGKRIENIYDYTYAIESLKIGAPVGIVVMRNGERLEMQITPISRE